VCIQHDLPTVNITDSPGFNINFESAPFKLTREYLDLLGGPDSEDFKLFQDLFLRGFLALQKHIDGITAIIQVCYLLVVSTALSSDNCSSMPPL
jgi:phosphatidylinositol kinase/protein kinase (PI-3  family)